MRQKEFHNTYAQKVKSVKGLVWLSVHPPPLGVKSDMSTS